MALTPMNEGGQQWFCQLFSKESTNFHNNFQKSNQKQTSKTLQHISSHPENAKKLSCKKLNIKKELNLFNQE